MEKNQETILSMKPDTTSVSLEIVNNNKKSLLTIPMSDHDKLLDLIETSYKNEKDLLNGSLPLGEELQNGLEKLAGKNNEHRQIHKVLYNESNKNNKILELDSLSYEDHMTKRQLDKKKALNPPTDLIHGALYDQNHGIITVIMATDNKAITIPMELEIKDAEKFRKMVKKSKKIEEETLKNNTPSILSRFNILKKKPEKNPEELFKSKYNSLENIQETVSKKFEAENKNNKQSVKPR